MNWSTRCRVVIDTNVFVSGLVFGGNSVRVVDRFESGKIQAIISPATLMELEKQLGQFRMNEKRRIKLLRAIELGAIKVLPKKRVRVVRDPKDNMFLEAAWAGKADYLVTGDKDLLVLKQFKRTKIVKPREFLATIDKEVSVWDTGG